MPTLLDAGASTHGWSTYGAVLQCPQKYAWTHILSPEEGGGRQLNENTAIIRGSLIHTGLAHHYRRLQAEQESDDPKKWFTPFDAIKLQALKEGSAWEAEVEYCTEALKEYIQHYGLEKFKIVAVEQAMYTNIGKSKVTGRADLIVQASNKKVYIMDHKTTSRITNAQKNYYSISGQLLGYSYMGREIFKDLWGGMLLNLVQHKPKRKFVRIDLPPSPNMLARFPDMVREAQDRIDRYSSLPVDKWPMAMNELVCYHRYGACEFIDKCKWGKNI